MARSEGKGATQKIRDPQTSWHALPRKRRDRPAVADLLAPGNQLVKSDGWKAGLVHRPAQPTDGKIEDILDAMGAEKGRG